MRLGDAHQRERRVLAVGRVEQDDFKLADGCLAVAEGDDGDPGAVARPVEQVAGDAILVADHLVESRRAGKAGDDLLKCAEGPGILVERQPDEGRVEEGLLRVDRIPVVFGDLLVIPQREEIVLFLLRPARLVHQLERALPLRAAQAGGHAALDLPAAGGRPHQVGRQARRKRQQQGGREHEGAATEREQDRHGREGDQGIRAGGEVKPAPAAGARRPENSLAGWRGGRA